MDRDRVEDALHGSAADLTLRHGVVAHALQHLKGVALVAAVLVDRHGTLSIGVPGGAKRQIGTRRPGHPVLMEHRQQPPAGAPKLVQRLQEKRQTHRDHGRIYRGAFVIAGVVVLLAGLAMLALPGPAFVVIPIGLAILSLEFAWAGNALDSALVKADKAKAKAGETTPRQRVLSGVAVAAAAAAFVVAAILYDIPLLPV